MKKDCLIGTWAEIPSPYVTDIMSVAGLDFSIIDMEHGVIDFETAQNMIFAAHGRKKKIFVRVPAIDESWILRSLDMGCDGMIFPQVSSEKDIENIIKYSCYKPIGNKGFNPYITAGNYHAVDHDYFERENKRITLGVILEGKEVFDKIDILLNFDEINIYYIGQYDLSMALGVPGEVSHPKVISYMESAVKKIRKYNKMAGCMVHSIEEAKYVIDMGFDFIVYKVDSGLLFQTISDFVKGVNE